MNTDLTFTCDFIPYFDEHSGKVVQYKKYCDYVRLWESLLSRVYSERELKRNPSYAGCSVCEEWHTFSKFKTWVQTQPNDNWRNLQLDKDILIVGNKVYSPDTCVFIDKKTNTFITDSKKRRGGYLIGVKIHNKTKRFIAQCCNPFVGKKGFGRYVGMFATELEAHKAWQAKKHEYACQLADMQEDERVAKALRERYAPDKDWIEM